jgi:hypothetical protein
VTLVAADESERSLTGAQLRSALGLRSTWVEPSVLELLPAARTMTYGGATSLTGFVHGGATVALESETATQDWAPAGAIVLGASGGFSTLVKPAVTTRYRLAFGGARVGLTRIDVAPHVAATVSISGASGAIRPTLAGVAVQLQQKAGSAWSTVATGVTAANGSFTFAQTLQSGSYRVRCAPGHGLVPGVSATTVLP